MEDKRGEELVIYFEETAIDLFFFFCLMCLMWGGFAVFLLLVSGRGKRDIF